MVNEAWLLGDQAVLRIMFADECEQEARREASVVPFLIANGAQTPALHVYEAGGDLTQKPYTIYERARGELLGYIEPNHLTLANAYQSIGREMARIHALKPPKEVVDTLYVRRNPDPIKALQKTLDQGLIEPLDAALFERLVEFIEPYRGAPGADVLSHRDIHPWNVFVSHGQKALGDIIDWGDAAFDDPAVEFSSMTLEAVPPMIEGYRQAGGKVDAGFIARSCWAGLALAHWEIRTMLGVHENRFDRRWWRHPLGGWQKTDRLVRSLLDSFA